MTDPTGPTPHPDPPWRLAAAAARRNLGPGVVLTAFAVGLLLAYWTLPAVRGPLDAVAAWRDSHGLPVVFAFSAISTAIFAAVIPWLVQRLRPRVGPHQSPRQLLALIIFWMAKGIEIELLYRGLAWALGDDPTLSTVAGKIAFDQVIYVPVWAIPTSVLMYAWVDAQLSGSRLRRQSLAGGWARWYRRDVLPVIVGNWSVWLPAVAVIYNLPTALQLPIQNIVLCFWSLLLLFMVDQQGKASRG